VEEEGKDTVEAASQANVRMNACGVLEGRGVYQGCAKQYRALAISFLYNAQKAQHRFHATLSFFLISC
jgi:hypothetical protein